MDTSSLYFPDNLKSIHSKLNLSSKPLSLSSPFSHQVALTLQEFSSNLASLCYNLSSDLNLLTLSS